MKITQLTAENVKRLEAVHIEPDGSVVIIGGNNAQGKTSVLDSIAMALGGGKLIPEHPVRHGTDHASITVDLDNGLTVTRDWGDKGTRLVVRRKGQRAPVGRPQSVLDELVGALTFDPVAYASLHPREQYQRLCDLVGIDLTAYHQKRAKIFEERTAVNRNVKRAEAVFDDMPHHPDAPKEPLDSRDLDRQLQEVYSHNRRVESAESRAHSVREQITDLRQDIKACEEQIQKWQARIREKYEKMAALRAEQMELTERIDEPKSVGDLHEQISKINEINEFVRQNEAREQKWRELQIVSQESQELTDKIEALDQEVQDKLAAANFPLPGLTVGDKQVIYQGVPLEQASAAERLRVSVAIAAALNPKLRVMLIRDASLLDASSMKHLADLAEKYDLQLWVERVGDSDEGAVIIEDGKVRS